ncbi:hypothetical protein HispidOSU_012021 [Sigmodon hispidus]
MLSQYGNNIHVTIRGNTTQPSNSVIMDKTDVIFRIIVIQGPETHPHRAWPCMAYRDKTPYPNHGKRPCEDLHGAHHTKCCPYLKTNGQECFDLQELKMIP